MSPSLLSAELIERFQRYAAQPGVAASLELLTILAFAGELRITMWSELAGRLGATPDGKTWSTKNLRPLASQLVEAGLVSEDAAGFHPAFGSKALVWRWAAQHPRFDRLLSAAGVFMAQETNALAMAVITRAANAEGWLRSAAGSGAATAGVVGFELCCAPYDAAWLASLPEGVRAILIEHALAFAESAACAHEELYRGVVGDPATLRLLGGRAREALAGLALLRGDVTTLEALASEPGFASLAPALAAAAALAAGRIEEGSRLAAKLNLDAIMLGSSVLQLSLWLAARSVGAANPRVVAHARHKKSPFAQTYRAAQMLGADGAGKVRVAGELLLPLVTALGLMAKPQATHGAASFERIQWWTQAFVEVSRLQLCGYSWLRDQIVGAANALLGDDRSASALGPRLPPNPGVTVVGAPSESARWELELRSLESLAAAVHPHDAAAQKDGAPTLSRIVWRARPRYVEPWLQTINSKSGVWTSGRKLAMQHLFGDTETTRALPAEDLEIARHIELYRVKSGRYVQTDHRLADAGLRALVGHPRVHWGDEAGAREVVLGKPLLRVEETADALLLAAEPQRLTAGVWLHLHEGRIVLYEIGKQQAALFARIGEGMRFPADGRERLMQVVTSLRADFTVDSSAEAPARGVVADVTPWLRLTPRAMGLSVRAGTKPLGSQGPFCIPGAGARRVVATIDGAPVHAERDLKAELAALAVVHAACPSLASFAEGEHAYRLDAPNDVLELVAALSALGERVRVEWPQGQPFRLRERATRTRLRGSIALESGYLALDASLDVGDGEELPLSELLLLLAERPGRFVRLASGDYIELEDDLRDVLDGLAAAAKRAAKGRVQVPLAAVSLLDQLGLAPNLRLDATAAKWRSSIERVMSKTAAVPRGLEAELRAYQIEGYRWLARLAELELGACLADDMGLGKTVQIIALLLQRAKLGPAIVVAPTSVCDNWRREIERFAPSLRVRPFWGLDRTGALDTLGDRDVVVTSYALLPLEIAALAPIAWGTAVLDEAQLIKNAETQRAQAAFALKAKARVVATGTPIENRAADLVSLFRFLNPGLLDESRIESAEGGLVRGMRRIIAPFILRRTKAQVLDDLPPITEIQHNVTLSVGEAKLYDGLRRAAVAKLDGALKSQEARFQVFAELMRLRRACCHPELVAPTCGLASSKLASFLELVTELVEARHRALVFSQFTDVLALVRPMLDAAKISYQYLDGSTPVKARARAVDAFQAGEGDVFLISLRAGGFGLNLTGADYVIHLDPWWNPAVESQATDRAHRIGQTRPVTVYRLVTQGTIESRIVELHREKRALADAVLAGADQAVTMTAEDLRGLLDDPSA